VSSLKTLLGPSLRFGGNEGRLTDIVPEKTAERRRYRRRNGIACIEHRQSLGNRLFGYQPHDDRRRHRPEAADRHAEQSAAYHQHQIVRGEGYDSSGDDQEQRKRRHHHTPVDPLRQPCNEETCHHREDAGNRDRLARMSFGHIEICGDRRQKGDRHEFRCDQDGDAKRQREDSAPGSNRYFGVWRIFEYRVWPEWADVVCSLLSFIGHGQNIV